MGEILKNTVTKTTTPQVSEYKRRVDKRYVAATELHWIMQRYWLYTNYRRVKGERGRMTWKFKSVPNAA